MELERLYKTTKSGATQIFDISVVGDTYIVEWGQLNGKIQAKSTTCKAMNVGRSNESSPEEQAVLEAKAVWTKKQKANYSTSPEAPKTVDLPMKVSKYQDHKSKVKFPCYISPKLNGVNAEYRLVNNELILLSRGGERYPVPEHQVQHVMATMDELNTESLNGEMYKHGEFLQDIMSATKKHNTLTPELQFMVFDLPTVRTTYKEKVTDLAAVAYPFVASIEIVEVQSYKEIEAFHTICVAKGLEGVIIRNKDSVYEYNTRSTSMLKYKVAQDAEFEVVGYSLDKNGHAVFKATTGTKDFKVKLKGTNQDRLDMAANADSYIGQYLKIEYEMLSKDLVPQKPVGIMFRKVNTDGEATE